MIGVSPPDENGKVLCVPSFQALPELVKKNQLNLGLLSQKWVELRAIARLDVVDLLGLDPKDVAKPWIMCGHQPEVCHPGVWAKYFVSKGLSKASGAVAFNLVADADICRQKWLPFPLASQDNRLVRGTMIVGKGPPGTSWEQVRRANLLDKGNPIWQQMATCFGLDPMGQKYESTEQHLLGENNTIQRRVAQGDLGLDLSDLLQSKLSRTVGFGLFFASILCEIQSFSRLHNLALAGFRNQQGVGNTGWPVANLGHQGEWYETPFWLLGTTMGPRMPLWVKLETREIVLGGEPGKCLARLEVRNPKGWLDALGKHGLGIRPKALANTLFLRWLVCDLFVHGLGGAIYDSVTDEIGRGWFGCEAPTFAVVSATLRLPLPKEKEGNEPGLRCKLRDLWWHPERLGEPGRLNEADLQEWLSLRNVPKQRQRAKVLLWRLHIQANQHYGMLEEQMEKARLAKASNALANYREWPWIWYSGESLGDLLCPLLDPQLYGAMGNPITLKS